MLSSNVRRHRRALSRYRCPQRSALVPQQLNLLGDPIPDPQVWDQLTTEQRITVIDTMARIIRKAVVPPTGTTTAQTEKTDD
jgi:hypothetical protein